MDELDEIRLIVAELYGGLETLPYHVFLGVREDAQGDALRKAYHERARALHPDRFYSLEDEALREKIYAIYKRVTEAYRILSDPAARARYEEQRRQGGAARLDLTDRAAARETIANPGARKYYQNALAAEQRGNLAAAKLNLKLALSLEPDNELLKAKLEALG